MSSTSGHDAAAGAARARPPDERRALARLEADGLVRATERGHRTTRRWQGAMARAAFQLAREGGELADLRVPIVRALIEIYRDEVADEELAAMAVALLPIEAAELPFARA